MSTFHRHHDPVDHSFSDHNHGTCTEHAHWAAGTHAEGVPMEAAEHDPLGHQVETHEAPVEEADPTPWYWFGYFRQRLVTIASGCLDPKVQARRALDAYEQEHGAWT